VLGKYENSNKELQELQRINHVDNAFFVPALIVAPLSSPKSLPPNPLDFYGVIAKVFNKSAFGRNERLSNEWASSDSIDWIDWMLNPNSAILMKAESVVPQKKSTVS
jgi:hypothetical protein